MSCRRDVDPHRRLRAAQGCMGKRTKRGGKVKRDRSQECQECQEWVVGDLDYFPPLSKETGIISNGCICAFTFHRILSEQPSKLRSFWTPWCVKFWSCDLICKKVSLNQKTWLPNVNRTKTLTWRVAESLDFKVMSMCLFI